MNQLTEYERITLLMIIGIGDRKRSLRDARNLFNEMFTNKNPISVSTVKRTLDRFESLHTVKNAKKAGRPKISTTIEKSEEIIERIMENPKTSTHQLALDHGISQTSVRRILKKEKAHPYK
ncbi:hypothetical protein CBL_20989, partial [Carabus blaptoides fortunei]